MILDEFNEFADATALDTSGTDTDLIGDVIDLGATTPDLGNGQPVYLVIQVDTTVTSGGSATVQFHLASDAAAAIATDGSASYHYSSSAIAKATLVAGYEIITPVPLGTYERYLGILTTTGTAALTAGKINAFLTLDPKGWKSYPDATN
ncbi:MAG: hypothetical protein Unbinned3065contig1002_10 [Prokaryotic dsDNA virus sp.]|nr:MAG: hypothetical protein Unbinned3065contig1002_10 [Prokaryotic dsDNA virus sp.]|tara:strand:- start:4667 stop:5113 length:447 start_codon:yes stop_codon:yes gene_type:complete